jgi:Kdo2-lipid IVA lauroyltransferase/acyltransferase
MNAVTNNLLIGLIKLISLLPMWVLYRFSDLLYPLMYYIVKYRKKVVYENLKMAFPEKSDKEITRIAKKFYRHFCDLFFEVFKMVTISPQNMRKRMKFTDTTQLMEEFKNKKHILTVMAHYTNWEWGASLSMGSYPYHYVAIYKPLENVYFDKMILKMRSRFGCELIPMRNTARNLAQNIAEGRLSITNFLVDQSPVQTEIVYCTNFFNLKTPIQLGIEKLAVKTKQPVYFFKYRKVKRGYYEVEPVKLCDDASLLKQYELTDLHAKVLEDLIRENPQYWLWSHRRWKYMPK